MKVGKKIKLFLEQHGISQVEFSKEIGMTPVKLNLSLNGHRRLKFSEYQTICWALGVKVDAFIEPVPPTGVQ